MPPSPWLSALQWAGDDPACRQARCYAKGFRVRRITLVTTLLDPQLYPPRSSSKPTGAVGDWKCAWTTSKP